jgi:hypothetical protein
MLSTRFFVWATVLAAVVIGASGCTQHVGSLALVSTLTPDYENIASAAMSRNVEAERSRTWFLFIPFGSRPTFEEAIDEALAANRGDFMTNARFYTNDWTILLFSHSSRRVVGDVGNSRSLDTLTRPKSR